MTAPMISIILALLVTASACDLSTSPNGLKGQVNLQVRFYGLAVDEKGEPLDGATISYQVDAYPKDWTFNTRDRPYDVSFASATSGPDGRFQFDVSGCILRLKDASREGYRHLYELSASDKFPSVSGYRLISWSDPQYQSDVNNPAVFVFVREGAREVSVLPSVGGSYAYGKQWRLYKSIWPKKPSLTDVIYSGPTTKKTE